jgi:Uma2 family endonuclease
MVTTPTKTPLISGEELLAMGDIGPCELVDGKIVPMSPAGGVQGFIEARLVTALYHFVQEYSLGWVMTGEVGIYTRRKPDRVRGADVVFLSKERWPGRPPKGFLEVAPELVVEIMSPNYRWQDVRQKLVEYFAIGVRWVWIVEPENRTVLVFRAVTDIQQYGMDDMLVGEGLLEGFALAVANLFVLVRQESS